MSSTIPAVAAVILVVMSLIPFFTTISYYYNLIAQLPFQLPELGDVYVLDVDQANGIALIVSKYLDPVQATFIISVQGNVTAPPATNATPPSQPSPPGGGPPRQSPIEPTSTGSEGVLSTSLSASSVPSTRRYVIFKTYVDTGVNQIPIAHYVAKELGFYNASLVYWNESRVVIGNYLLQLARNSGRTGITLPRSIVYKNYVIRTLGSYGGDIAAQVVYNPSVRDVTANSWFSTALGYERDVRTSFSWASQLVESHVGQVCVNGTSCTQSACRRIVNNTCQNTEPLCVRQDGTKQIAIHYHISEACGFYSSTPVPTYTSSVSAWRNHQFTSDAVLPNIYETAAVLYNLMDSSRSSEYSDSATGHWIYLYECPLYNRTVYTWSTSMNTASRCCYNCEGNQTCLVEINCTASASSRVEETFNPCKKSYGDTSNCASAKTYMHMNVMQYDEVFLYRASSGELRLWYRSYFSYSYGRIYDQHEYPDTNLLISLIGSLSVELPELIVILAVPSGEQLVSTNVRYNVTVVDASAVIIHGSSYSDVGVSASAFSSTYTPTDIGYWLYPYTTEKTTTLYAYAGTPVIYMNYRLPSASIPLCRVACGSCACGDSFQVVVSIVIAIVPEVNVTTAAAASL